MNDKLLTLLGFASKARQLSFGMDSAVSSLKSRKAKLILICGGVSDKSRKEIIFHSEKVGVKALALDDYDMQTVSDAVGKRCGILSVNDSEFAKALLAAVNKG